MEYGTPALSDTLDVSFGEGKLSLEGRFACEAGKQVK